MMRINSAMKKVTMKGPNGPRASNLAIFFNKKDGLVFSF